MNENDKEEDDEDEDHEESDDKVWWDFRNRNHK
jgi:hypothetical protein